MTAEEYLRMRFGEIGITSDFTIKDIETSIIDAFNAGVKSVPSDAELVDEIQSLREELDKYKNMCNDCKDENLEEARELNVRLDKFIKDKMKYRWHDLAKNPDDLPKDNDFVIVKRHTDFYNENTTDKYVLGFAQYDNKEWQNYFCDYLGEVFAWKEID